MTTNILLITNSRDITSDFIVNKLNQLETPYYRLNTDFLSGELSITIEIESETYVISDSKTDLKLDLNEFSSVYYRRPELPDLSYLDLDNNETSFVNNEITYFLEGVYKILIDKNWLNPVYAIREAENKIYQLLLAKSLGFNVPKSIASNNYNHSKSFFENNDSCIIKPLKSGLIGESDKVVFTSELIHFPSEVDEISRCPVYLQELIPKKLDLRVTVVRDKVFATAIHSQGNNETKVDWRRGENKLLHSKHTLPESIKSKCIKLVKLLNLQFGAIDLILDKNDEYIFLEINPNGQWAWIESQTGHPISEEIVKTLKNEKADL